MQLGQRKSQNDITIQKHQHKHASLSIINVSQTSNLCCGALGYTSLCSWREPRQSHSKREEMRRF